MNESIDHIKNISGLYRIKRYGKWQPFCVGVANVELPEFELHRRLKFQISRSYDLDDNVEIVELKIS